MNDPLTTSRDSWGRQEGLNRLTAPVPFHGSAKADHLLYRGSRRAALLSARSRGTPLLSAHDPAAAADRPLCQRRETGGLSVAQNNSAAHNIAARNTPAVGNRATARNTRSRRAAPP